MFLEWENNSGKFQIISGKFENNAINDVKQISISHVIRKYNRVMVSVITIFWQRYENDKIYRVLQIIQTHEGASGTKFIARNG